LRYIMKNFLLFVFLVSFLPCFSQTKDNRLVIGTVDSVYSNILREKRKIWVHIPDTGDNMIYGKRHFPVVYLLDGDAHFYSVVGMIHQLSEINGNQICPDMIVVGIPNTDRTRDLTPTHVNKSIYMDSSATKTSGGGEKFTEFLEKELIPYIDANYPTSPYRMLIGHSFGGLLVVNTLIHHSDLFNAYVAIDPSLWWDHQKILKQAESEFDQKKYSNKNLFLAVANTMQKEMDTLRVIHDTAGNTLHIRSILEFAKYLGNRPGTGIRYSWKYYSDDNHGSVPLIAEYDALHFFFDFYKLPAVDLDSLSVEVVTRHYKII
jgi:predicted alpha/beta superfamily hydrolase